MIYGFGKEGEKNPFVWSTQHMEKYKTHSKTSQTVWVGGRRGKRSQLFGDIRRLDFGW